MSTNSALLERAISAATRGDRSQARAILIYFIRREPQNETAWLYLAELVEREEYAVDCFEHVLKLNPNNETARRRLEEIRRRASPQIQIGPPSISAVPTSSPPVQNQPTHTRPFNLKWAIAGVLSLLLVCAVFIVGLIWQGYYPLISQPQIVTVIVPVTLASHGSPLPLSTAIAHPTFPPTWTPEPKPTIPPTPFISEAVWKWLDSLKSQLASLDTHRSDWADYYNNAIVDWPGDSQYEDALQFYSSSMLADSESLISLGELSQRELEPIKSKAFDAATYTNQAMEHFIFAHTRNVEYTSVALDYWDLGGQALTEAWTMIEGFESKHR